jgi:hypothetical protein
MIIVYPPSRDLTLCVSRPLRPSLQLDALSECTSADAVRQELATFPSKVKDIYLRVWDRIIKTRANDALLVKTVLVWVLHASRSMTVEELIRAVAMSPETLKFEPERLVSETTLVSLWWVGHCRKEESAC